MPRDNLSLRLALIALGAALLVPPTALPAQLPVIGLFGGIGLSAGVGGGAAFRDREAGASGSYGHVLAFAQLSLPLLPVAVRADGMVVASAGSAGPLVGTLDAVFRAPLPIITPYALAGWGTYGAGKSGSQSGWNAGVGARVGLGGKGIFAELRRHERFTRDLVTVGITM